jgi:hypothetical protein
MVRRAIIPAVLVAAALSTPNARAVTPAPRKIELVVMDFGTEGAAPKGLGRALAEAIANDAARAGTFTVLSQGDLAAQLPPEEGGHVLAAAQSEESFAALLGALGADRLLSGNVTLVEAPSLISAKVIDVRHARTLRRLEQVLHAPSEAELLDTVLRLAFEVLTGQKPDATGTLRILVSEKGAEVALDGRDVGVTPLTTSPRVSAGPHRITVQKAEFVTWEGTLTVTAGGTVPLNVTLVPLGALAPKRNVYVEIFGGLTPSPQWGI